MNCKGCGKDCACIDTYIDGKLDDDPDIVTCGETRTKITGEEVLFLCSECEKKEVKA